MMTFEQALARRDAQRHRFRALAKRMEGAYQRAVVDAFRRVHPRQRKLPEWHKVPDDVKAPVRERWVARADRVAAFHRTRDDRYPRVLTRLARDRVVPVVGELVHYENFWNSTYSTQTASSHYARGAAMLCARHVQACGVAAEFREGEKYGAKFWEVRAYTTEAGKALMKHKPGLTVREWLKACWEQGTNPRVYNPFLPHGLEERLGVDYFGNDVLRPIRVRRRTT